MRRTARGGRPRVERPEGLAGQLGERVEALRKEKTWSAADLATAARIGLGTVIRLEAGRTSPTLDTVLAVAGALGISGSELLKACPEWTTKPIP